MTCMTLLLAAAITHNLALADSEYKTKEEVEAEAKEVLSGLLGYLAGSDEKLKQAVRARDEAAQKVKRLKDGGEAPNSLRDAIKECDKLKKAAVACQTELVVGLLPADAYDSLRPGVKKKGFIFQFVPKEKADRARQLASHFSGLVQFADTKYRDALKEIRDQSAARTKYQADIREATDTTDKEAIKKKLADAEAKWESASKTATRLRKGYVERLSRELYERSGVKPTSTGWFQFGK